MFVVVETEALSDVKVAVTVARKQLWWGKDVSLAGYCRGLLPSNSIEYQEVSTKKYSDVGLVELM